MSAAVVRGWLELFGRSAAEGELAHSVTTLTRNDPDTARAVFRRLRSWGGGQSRRYGLSHADAGAAARQIAAELSITPDDIRPARRSLERELNEFRDFEWAQELQYLGRWWDRQEELRRMPVVCVEI